MVEPLSSQSKIEQEFSKQIEIAIAGLDKQFGKGSVIRLTSTPEPWPSISTGAMTLDLALGIGGLPRGRIVEIFGNEGSAKTTVALTTVANAQAQGEQCLFVDAEHAIDANYAKALNVDLDTLLFAQPSTGEEALNIVDAMVRTGEIGVVVVDSVAALVPKAELEGDIGDSHMGLQPRMMSQAMRKLTGIASDTKTLIIFTNQMREKLGVMFGNPNVSPGGRALKFASSVRIELRKKSDVTSKEGINIASTIEAKVIKNKMAPPLRKAQFDVEYGKGINKIGCVLDLALERGIVKKAGSWFALNDTNLGQGRERTIEYLTQDTATLEAITKELKEIEGFTRSVL